MAPTLPRPRDAWICGRPADGTMQLTVRDVASFLGVSEVEVHRWVAEKGLPVIRVHDQLRFNRAEVLGWAARRRLASESTRFQRLALFAGALGDARLGAALEAGAVVHDLAGDDRPGVLHALVAALPLPANVDRAELEQVLLARGSMLAAGVGEGIAIPDARSPIVLGAPRPQVVVAFLARPVPLVAGAPAITTLFAIVSPTVRAHLSLLSRLAAALRDPDFARVVARRGTRDELLAEARRVDALAGRDA